MSFVTKMESSLSASGYRERKGRHNWNIKIRELKNYVKLKKKKKTTFCPHPPSLNSVLRLPFEMKASEQDSHVTWHRPGDSLLGSKHAYQAWQWLSVCGPFPSIWHKDHLWHQEMIPHPFPHFWVGLMWPKPKRSLPLSLMFITLW